MRESLLMRKLQGIAHTTRAVARAAQEVQAYGKRASAIAARTSALESGDCASSGHGMVIAVVVMGIVATRHREPQQAYRAALAKTSLLAQAPP